MVTQKVTQDLRSHALRLRMCRSSAASALVDRAGSVCIGFLGLLSHQEKKPIQGDLYSCLLWVPLWVKSPHLSLRPGDQVAGNWGPSEVFLALHHTCRGDILWAYYPS